MIPPRSTPIKNEVLTEIFAKGRLTQTEMRITAYIIRNSWGYSFNGIRQQWTKPLTITQIAKNIGLLRCNVSTVINQMLKEKKLVRKNNQYKFNEHYEEWVLPNSNSVVKSKHQCCEIQTVVLPNSNTQAQAKQDENKLISTPKETIKETIKENTTAPNEKLKTNNEKFTNEKTETNSETLKTNNKEIKPESKGLKAKAKKEKIMFNPISGRFAHLDKEFMERLRKAFPRANVEAEVRKAELWLYANPAKRKKNYERFLINWLSRAENPRAENPHKGNPRESERESTAHAAVRKGGSIGKSGRYIPISEKDYPTHGEPFVSRAGEW